MSTIEIHPATPNLVSVSFSFPNRMYYVVGSDGKILALCQTRELATLFAKFLSSK